MANKKKGTWRKERASMNSRSNKYRPAPADQDKRPATGSTGRYWRGGYTRKDGTRVKGHYVRRAS